MSTKATRARTIKLLALFFNLSPLLGLMPFKYNLDTFKFTPLNINKTSRSKKYLILHYIHIINLVAYSLYLWTSKLYLIDNYRLSQSITDAEIHLSFTLAASLIALICIFHCAYRQDFCRLLNEFIRFSKRFAESSKKQTTSYIEYFIQIVIIFAPILLPSSFAILYLMNPFDPRYQLWLIIPETKHPPPWTTWTQLILMLIYLISHCCNVLVVIIAAMFIGITISIYLGSVELWLKQIRSTVEKQSSPPEFAHSPYQQIQVLHKIMVNLICPFLLPFAATSAYIICINLIYVTVIHHEHIPNLFLFSYIWCITFIIILIVTVTQAAANLHTISNQLLRSCAQKSKKAKSTLFLRKFKSCSPIYVRMGFFFILKKSTTYKFVLFLVLYTFKAILMFGKGKYE